MMYHIVDIETRKVMGVHSSQELADMNVSEGQIVIEHDGKTNRIGTQRLLESNELVDDSDYKQPLSYISMAHRVQELEKQVEMLLKRIPA